MLIQLQAIPSARPISSCQEAADGPECSALQSELLPAFHRRRSVQSSQHFPGVRTLSPTRTSCATRTNCLPRPSSWLRTTSASAVSASTISSTQSLLPPFASGISTASALGCAARSSCPARAFHLSSSAARRCPWHFPKQIGQVQSSTALHSCRSSRQEWFYCILSPCHYRPIYRSYLYSRSLKESDFSCGLEWAAGKIE